MNSSLTLCRQWLLGCVALMTLGLMGCPKQVKVGAQDAKTPLYQMTLQDLNGKDFPLRELQGKVTIIDFFASHCNDCLQIIPQLQRLHNTYKDKDFNVLGIALEKKGLPLTTFIEFFAKKAPLEYPIVLANKALYQGKTELGRIIRVPQYKVLDKCGSVRHTHMKILPFKTLEMEVKKLLAEQKTCPTP
ncbi:MAG TPA: hypothetical protein DCE42_09740 [Myxococcales bacterium]|nr:hypothetical protein [Deltaproteobacteria bacterium]HAA55029.1 hypothetical protein [Myxococcales bacterium]